MTKDSKDKRRFVRANLACKIIVCIPDKHTILSHTENVGEGGIKVVIKEKLELASTVGLELYLTDEPIICKGRIVWGLEQENKFDTGIEFIEIKDSDTKVIRNFIEAI